ncbi:MAG: hypothetical protein ACLP7I_03900 [Limisphaerales bacterium]
MMATVFMGGVSAGTDDLSKRRNSRQRPDLKLISVFPIPVKNGNNGSNNMATMVQPPGLKVKHPARNGKGGRDERFVTAMEIPPVVSAETAVRVSVVADTENYK